MIGWMKKAITAIYNWLCFWLLCRKEYFTPQLTRMMIHHGIFFWIIFFLIAGFLFYHIFFNPSFGKTFFCLAGLIGLAWLSDHLNDYSREHPDIMN